MISFLFANKMGQNTFEIITFKTCSFQFNPSACFTTSFNIISLKYVPQQSWTELQTYILICRHDQTGQGRLEWLYTQAGFINFIVSTYTYWNVGTAAPSQVETNYWQRDKINLCYVTIDSDLHFYSQFLLDPFALTLFLFETFSCQICRPF